VKNTATESCVDCQVAEQLINPFGEDDDDFEMNWIIDRNNQISLLVADDMFGQIPPLEKDIFFGEPPPDCLPYTKSAARSMSQPHLGSTADLRSTSVRAVLMLIHG